MDIDWPLLTLFTRLKSLKLKCVNYEAGAVYESMQNMRGLTELKIRFRKIDRHADDDFRTLHFISPLTALQSLGLGVCSTYWCKPKLPYALHEMTQLTKLHIRESLPVMRIDCLTQMVDLKITKCRMPSSVLLSALASMTLLESLKITNDKWRSALPSSLLRPLQHLKRLSFVWMAAELDFYLALARLSGLTELHFVPGNDEQLDSNGFRTQVNLLTRLRVLKLAFSTTDVSPLEYILEGRLLRLRDISFLCSHFGEDEEKELRRRLPCLEEINFNSL